MQIICKIMFSLNSVVINRKMQTCASILRMLHKNKRQQKKEEIKPFRSFVKIELTIIKSNINK